MTMIKKLTNTGDTIVEVLIAIAVVSAALGGAFVSVNNSLQGTIASQERGEALKLLEGQTERLKQATDSPGWTLPAVWAGFCMDDSANRVASCSAGTDGRYSLSIQRIDSLDNRTYQATATWDRVGGGEQQSIDIFYRTKS